MRELILLSLVLLGITILSGCTSTNKIRMKNCESIGDDFYICEEIPEKPIREFGPRR